MSTIDCRSSPVVGGAGDSGQPPLPSYRPIRPRRIVDTRSGLGTPSAEPLGARCVLRLDLSDSVVPVDAAAVALSVTAISPVIGFMTVFPCAEGRPLASSVNPRPDVPTPNLVVAVPDAQRRVCLYTEQTSELIIDVQGWWSSGPNRFTPIEPVRMYDTRELPGGKRLPGGHVRNIQIAGRLGVPDDAVAAVVNLTVTKGADQGWLTAYPCGSSPPLASNANYLAEEARAVAAIVGLGAGGQLCVTSPRDVHVIVDAVGYYSPAPAFGSGVELWPTVGSRLVDTREGVGGPGRAFRAGETRRVSVGSVGGSATAAFVNLIALAPADRGFLTLFDCDGDRPTVSSVNMEPGADATNLAAIRLDGDQSFCVYASTATDVVIDLFGSMQAPPGSPVGMLDVSATSAGTEVEIWPAFDPAGGDYVIECGAQVNRVDLAVVPLGRNTVGVNGVTVDRRVTTVVLRPDDIVTLDLRAQSVGRRSTHRLRCLPPGFPHLDVDRPGEPAPGWYMTTLTATDAGTFLVILDRRGVPLWYRRTEEPTTNFQRFSDGRLGHSVLSRAYGFDPALGLHVTDLAGGASQLVRLDDPDAFPLDHHEQLELGSGWSLLSYPVLEGIDLTVLNDLPNFDGFGAAENIVDGVLREIDGAGVPLWTWRASEHFSLEEVRFPLRFSNYPDLAEVDPYHINAVGFADDGTGDYVVTARHLDAAFRIDRQSGLIRWIVSSLPSDPLAPGYVANPDGAARLRIVGDPLDGPLRPHDARLVGEVLTMYDNRAGTSDVSRAVAYRIDEAAGTATLIWSLDHPGGGTGPILGSVQRLADERVLITWGALQPLFEEVEADGSRVLAVSQTGGQTFRVRKLPSAAFDARVLRATAGGTYSPAD